MWAPVRNASVAGPAGTVVLSPKKSTLFHFLLYLDRKANTQRD